MKVYPNVDESVQKGMKVYPKVCDSIWKSMKVYEVYLKV